MGYLPFTGSNFYLVAALTLFVIAFLKGAFGGGFALIGVPMLAMFIPPIEAAAIISPLVCLMDLFALAAYPPRTWDKTQLKILLPGAVTGMAFGAFLLGKADETIVAIAVGAIAVAFSTYWFLGRLGLGTPLRRERRPGPLAGYLWSGVSGFTGVLAHAGGPPLSVYLLPQRLEKTELAGTQTVFFMVGNYMKLMPYLFLGQLNQKTAFAALVLSPTIPLGVCLGRILHTHLDQNVIYMLCYTLVLATDIKIILQYAIW